MMRMLMMLFLLLQLILIVAVNGRECDDSTRDKL